MANADVTSHISQQHVSNTWYMSPSYEQAPSFGPVQPMLNSSTAAYLGDVCPAAQAQNSGSTAGAFWGRLGRWFGLVVADPGTIWRWVKGGPISKSTANEMSQPQEAQLTIINQLQKSDLLLYILIRVQLVYLCYPEITCLFMALTPACK